MTKPQGDAAPITVARRKLTKLKPFERNARQHPPEQVEKLARSLAEYGWTNPILIDATGEIVAGHGRFLAATAVHDAKGLIPNWPDTAEVPVIVLKHLTDAQRRAYRIADNKLPELGRWDEAMLKLELGDLYSLGVDFDVAVLPAFEFAGDPGTFLANIDAPVREGGGERSASGFVQLAFTVTQDERKDVLTFLREEQTRRKVATAGAALIAIAREQRP